MGFVMMGSGCPLQSSPIHHSFSSTPSSSLFSSSCHPICSLSCPRTSRYLKMSRKIVVCASPDDSVCANLAWKRRAIVVLGFSFLPFLKLADKSLQSLAAEVSELKSEANQRLEEKLPGGSSIGSFVSLFGAIGIFASGVLGALYALARKEKAASEATSESIWHKLKEKEATIISMNKKFESDLIKEQEVSNEKLRKAREEQQSLASQLRSANETVVGIGKELQKEKKMVEELKMCIDALQRDLTIEDGEKRTLQEKLRDKDEAIGIMQDRITLLSQEIKEKADNLHNLHSTLAEKEMELKILTSRYQELQDESGKLHSENKELKENILNNEKELELKISIITDMTAQIGVLQSERDEANRRLESIQKEYNELKSFSQEREAKNVKLLEDQERKLHRLEEQLDSSLNELNANKIAVADLNLERDNLMKMLAVESENIKDLKQELQVTRDSLDKSRNEVIGLTKQLQLSRDLCLDLEAEVSKVRADFAEARESLTKKAEEAMAGAESLSSELMSLREVLNRKIEELQTVSQDLSLVVEVRDSLQKELVDAYKKAETAAYHLQEEKIVTSSLKEELKALESQIVKEREARKSLEGDLEEATRALDEINQNALVLTRELEVANSQLSTSEEEKDALHKSIAEQKRDAKIARENLEDAHSLVMQLGEVRQSLDKRSKKLEDDLASAKGEILRLRSQMSSSKTVVNDTHQATVKVEAAKATTAAEVGKTEATATPTKRRSSRSKKVVPRQDDS